MSRPRADADETALILADGGDRAPVVFHGGLLDSVELLRGSPIARALAAHEFRRIFVGHRELGRSDKPHDVQAYATPTRVADAVAVLDEFGSEDPSPMSSRGDETRR